MSLFHFLTLKEPLNKECIIMEKLMWYFVILVLCLPQSFFVTVNSKAYTQEFHIWTLYLSVEIRLRPSIQFKC